MRKYGFIAASVILCGMMLVACQPKNETSSSPAHDAENSTEQSAADATSKDAAKRQTVEQVIDQYMVDTFGSQYSQGQVCIPQQMVIATDESDGQDIKVWGDFWVFNYNIAGDTLKTASGGSHPGLFHLKKASNGYEVTGFDQVGDGSQFEPTARKIFGDRYEAFMKMYSDDKAREQNRAQSIAKYVKAYGLKVGMYQDYGWPAVTLPE